MKTLDTYPFTRREKKEVEKETGLVCVVIICTIASAKVRRKEFNSWDEARKYADEWQEKNKNRIVYNVSIESL